MPDPRDPSDDPDAPASAEEQEQAGELRAALDDPSRTSAPAELARALSAAWDPRDLPARKHRELVDQALARSTPARRKARVIRVSFGAGAMLALAASVALVLWSGRHGPASIASSPALAVSRSTQELFDEQFALTGGETRRIDRIAMARATDLRDNEFARWGVR
jgi:hypothetical protein